MVDVTVMGAGIFGLSVAWYCQNAGAKVRVIDPNGVGAGASGGLLGALAPHTPDNWNVKKQFQLDSLILNDSLWPDVEALSGLPTGYARLGRLQALNDARAVELARARVHSAETIWNGWATWSVVDCADHPSWAPQSATGLLVHDTLSARVHPRRACLSLAEGLRMRGGEILREGQPAGQVVWATGVEGLTEIGVELGRSVGQGVKGQAALLQVEATGSEQIFVDGIHIVPHDDGTVAIGSTSERSYSHATTTDGHLDDLIARAEAAMPCLIGAHVIERWAGARPRTASRSPLLGQHPTRPGEYIANGGFKIGFGVAAKVGQTMADLIVLGQDNIPEQFRPQALLERV